MSVVGACRNGGSANRTMHTRQGIRLVVLIDHYWPALGGAEKQKRQVCQLLRDRGVQVRVLTRAFRPGLLAREDIDSIPIRRLGHSRVRVWSKVKFVVLAVLYLMKHRNEYDVLHIDCCICVTDLLAGFVAHLVTGKPYVIQIHGSADVPLMLRDRRYLCHQDNNFRWVPKFVCRAALNRARALIPNSSESEGYMEAGGLRRVIKILNGVTLTELIDDQKRQEARERLGLLHEAKIVVFVGALRREKNVIMLLRAWELLARGWSGPPLELLIIGKGENRVVSTEVELRRYVRRHQLQSVTFVGEVNNVQEFLIAADALVHPSLQEGLPNAVLEAMACGLPVVVSDIPGTRDLVPSDEYGGRFEPLNAGEIARIIRLVLVDSERARRIGRQGRVRIIDHFSFERAAGSFHAVYQRVLDETTTKQGIRSSRSAQRMMRDGAVDGVARSNAG